MAQSERLLATGDWNCTSAAFDAGTTIHEAFEAQAARSPDAVAVVYEGETLSYAELNARANRLAHYLRESGVGPDTRAAICVERSLEMMVGLLGILKAGGAYVPLDPEYPLDRLRYMLEDSAPVVLLAQGSLEGVRDLLHDYEGLLLDLEDEDPEWSGHASRNPEIEGFTPDRLAYVIYTSGSTGKPKGVMHTTAGYLGPSLTRRLGRSGQAVEAYLDVFRACFPEQAGYAHDQLERRRELSEAQRARESRNAASHLAFIAAGLRNNMYVEKACRRWFLVA